MELGTDDNVVGIECLLIECVAGFEKNEVEQDTSKIQNRDTRYHRNKRKLLIMSVNKRRKIDGKYLICELLGSGSYGSVYRVVDPEGNQFAAKFEHDTVGGTPPGSTQSTDNPSYLRHEHTVMNVLHTNRLQGTQTPRVYEFTRHGNYNVIIMDLFGETLIKLKRNRGSKFSTKTLLMIMKQCLRRLEYVHNCGFVHRDVKHNNIVIGRNSDQRDTIYLIDYGLSYRWSANSEHGSPDGSLWFSSIRANFSYTTNRADDIESLLYTMAYLEKGRLPWSGLNDIAEVALKKLQTSSRELFHFMPICYKRIRDHIKTLSYDAEPHYELYYIWINNEMRRGRFQDDGVYDWMPSASSASQRTA